MAHNRNKPSLLFKKHKTDFLIRTKIVGKNEPIFYCTLCNKFSHFSDLIDGNKCPYCNEGIFLQLYYD